MLGFGNKAVEMYKMISPIEHTRTKEAVRKYKVEPYVMSADVYGKGNLSGRGGWTWYTGSAGWMYEAGIRYILGLEIEDNKLKINPCIANNWKEYMISYTYGRSKYNIFVKNPNGKTEGISSFKLNDKEISDKEIKLVDDGKIYTIDVIM